jgi:hypothetical protein
LGSWVQAAVVSAARVSKQHAAARRVGGFRRSVLKRGWRWGRSILVEM